MKHIVALMTILISTCAWAGPLEDSGVDGGLVVVIGVDVTTAIEMGRDDRFLIQMLDTDGAKVRANRSAIYGTGFYGRVTASVFDGASLPYIDNLVNLIVANGTAVGRGEIDRVLAPGGVAIVDGRRTVKPVPETIGEWTHYLHGPGNNAIARDEVVGPPRRMQWRAEPLWGRDHHAEKGGFPTVRTVVSAAGRVFVLTDEIETSNMKISSKWTVVARNAFSGVRLWTTPVQTSGYQRDLPGIWRRLVVDDERVYTAFGAENTLVALDATTGKKSLTYRGTADMDEVVLAGGTLFVLLKSGALLARQAEDGRELWQWKPKGGEQVAPLTLAAWNGKVFLKTGRVLTCLSAETGREQYRSKLPGATATEDMPLARSVNYPGKLVVGEGVVLCSYGGKNPKKYPGWARSGYLGRGVGAHRLVREYGGKIGAFSASDGTFLWETEYYPDLQDGPNEIYIHEGTVLMGPLFDKTRDLMTGAVKAERSIVGRLWTEGHHYRCYMGKATSRYIITAKRGIEMIDIKGENHSRNNWARGTCQVGITPCNGLIYAPPHSCGCYMGAKLFGFWALAPDGGTREAATAQRPEKGSAYGDIKAPTSTDGWWTYRGGNARGGATSFAVSGDLKPAWKTRLGGRLTAATVAGGKAFVAQIDEHTLHALDSHSGKRMWSFTAGGRIDSPPTVPGGLVLFGCRDGYVYCLRADDGALVWRYRVAPGIRQAVAFDQLESVWPVHGSVLYQDGTVYAAAGRSSYLDGGIRLVGLDPATGALKRERVVRDEHAGAMAPPADAARRDRRTNQNWMDYKTDLAPDKSDSFSMHGSRNEVLVGGDESVYMRNMRFDNTLEEMSEVPPHLFSTSELLDGWEHNRAYWGLGTGNFSGLPVAYSWIIRKQKKMPVGLMMAFDDKTLWTVTRGKGYSVVATRRPAATDSKPDFQGERQGAHKPLWSKPVGIRPRSIVRAEDVLVLGGMAKGKGGNPRTVGGDGRLQIVSCEDGRTVRELKIDSPPVWDGMAAGDGELVIPCVDGSVVSLSGAKEAR
jgi:outer membrane protein assembly factor BamB